MEKNINKDKDQENVSKIKSKKEKIISVKSAVIIAVILIISVFAYSYKGIFIAATVDGVPISRLSVISELEKASGKAALDNIITLKIINDEAEKREIVISSDEIESEISVIEGQIALQNMTLDKLLEEQNMTREKLEEQIAIQKKLEKMLEDKLFVTDNEVNEYITNYQITIPEGQEDNQKNQIKEQLYQEKLNIEVNSFIQTLKSQADIKYFTDY